MLKLNKPSFGNNKFISAVHSIRESNLFSEPSYHGEKVFLVIKIFFQGILTQKKKEKRKKYGLEVDAKTESNVIIWCHVSECI